MRRQVSAMARELGPPSCESLGLERKAPDEGGHPFEGDLDRLVELLAMEVAPVGEVEAPAMGARLRAQAVDPEAEELREVHRDVPVARGHVPFGANDARVMDLAHGVGQELGALLDQGPSAPVGKQLSQLGRSLLRGVEGVSGTLLELVELLEDRVDRILGEDRGGARAGCLVAHDELAGLDSNGHPLQGLREGKRAFHDDRLRLVAPVDFGVDPGSLGCIRSAGSRAALPSGGQSVRKAALSFFRR